MNTSSDTDYYSDVFPYKEGHLHCEGIKVREVLRFLKDNNIGPLYTPCFIYSKSKIVSNVGSYLRPLETLPQKTVINYSVKANMNVTILKILKSLGCSCTLVSGYELKLCLELGFNPETLVLNGNGKQEWEIEMAVQCGCLLNVDSLFNLRHTVRVCNRLEKIARVLLRVNPDIDPKVHQYNITGKSGSKFGIDDRGLQEVIEEIRRSKYISLVGLHCHLGSTIEVVQPFRDSTAFLLKQMKNLRNGGFSDMRVLNIGGGLGIPYQKHASRTSVEKAESAKSLPSAEEIVREVADVLKNDDVMLILEPGRSLVGNAAILATSVLGMKSSGPTNYIVVDGSMTEVIRPALYQAYHHIDLAEPTQSNEDKKVYNVVGPVCESGDFLGKDRYLPTPHEGCLMAVFDVGAYCASMSSNYNMRIRPAEVLVDNTGCTVIRKPDTFESMMKPYLL